VTDTLWFYYWYFLWPSAGDAVPVEIAASSEPRVNVSLVVPVATGASNEPGVREQDLPMLKDTFAHEVAESLADTLRLALRFGPSQIITGHLDEQRAQPSGDSQVYHTVLVGDLLEDLRSLLPAGGLEQWLESPNTRFGGATPRELLRTQEMRLLRDLILEVRHGLPA
jgi:hypothetical protein